MQLMNVLIISVSCIITIVSAVFQLGEIAYPEKFRYHVNILINQKSACSGAIISKYFIVTSAQCVTKTKPDGFVVSVGSAWSRDISQPLAITSIIIKYNYVSPKRGRLPSNDIALLAVRKGIVFSNSVQPAQIAPTFFKFNRFTLTGYRTGSFIRRWRRYKTLPRVNTFKCNKSYDRRLAEDHFCGGYENSDYATCNHEEGSPLIAKKKLVGILTISVPCTRPIKAEVFTNLTYHYDWAMAEMDVWYENEGIPNPDNATRLTSGDGYNPVESCPCKSSTQQSTVTTIGKPEKKSSLVGVMARAFGF